MRPHLAAAIAVFASFLVGVAAMLPGDHFAAIHSGGALHLYFHVAVFGFIACLCAWSTRSVPVRLGLCLAVVVLGCATEVTEHIMYHSVVEWTDMVLDAMGAVAGTALGALISSARRRRA